MANQNTDKSPSDANQQISETSRSTKIFWRCIVTILCILMAIMFYGNLRAGDYLDAAMFGVLLILLVTDQLGY